MEIKNSIIIVLTIAIVGLCIYTFMPTNTIKIPENSDALNNSRDLYIEGCMSEDANYQFCACTYDKLEKEIGVSGIIQFGLDYETTGEIPENVVDIALSCL